MPYIFPFIIMSIYYLCNEKIIFKKKRNVLMYNVSVGEVLLKVFWLKQGRTYFQVKVNIRKKAGEMGRGKKIMVGRRPSLAVRTPGPLQGARQGEGCRIRICLLRSGNPTVILRFESQNHSSPVKP